MSEQQRVRGHYDVSGVLAGPQHAGAESGPSSADMVVWMAELKSARHNHMDCSLQASVLLDPYATAIIGRRKFGELGPVRYHCVSRLSYNQPSMLAVVVLHYFYS